MRIIRKFDFYMDAGETTDRITVARAIITATDYMSHPEFTISGVVYSAKNLAEFAMVHRTTAYAAHGAHGLARLNITVAPECITITAEEI